MGVHGNPSWPIVYAYGARKAAMYAVTCLLTPANLNLRVSTISKLNNSHYMAFIIAEMVKMTHNVSF